MELEELITQRPAIYEAAKAEGVEPSTEVHEVALRLVVLVREHEADAMAGAA